MKTTLYVKELDDGNEEIVDSNRILQLYKDIEDQNVTPYIEE
jgi:hypothetical protein